MFNKVYLVHIPGSTSYAQRIILAWLLLQVLGPLENGPVIQMTQALPQNDASVRVHYCSTHSSIFYNCHSLALCDTIYIYPSIHGQPVKLSSGERWVTPWMIHTHIHTWDQCRVTSTPISKMPLDCGRKLKYQERTLKKSTKSPWPPGDSNFFAAKHHHRDTPHAGPYLEIYTDTLL